MMDNSPLPGAASIRPIPKRIVIAALLFILVVGGWLRLSDLAYIEFKSDGATHHSHIIELVENGKHLDAGWKSSRGNYKPPLFYYLCAPAVWVSRDPIFLAGYIAALNTAALGLFMVLALCFFGPVAALTSAALFALSPWAIVYSRQIWNPDLLAPFGVVTLFGLLALWRKPDSRRWATIVPIASLAAWQLHDTGVVTIGLVGIVLLWHARRVRYRYVALGVALALLSMGPFLWRQLQTQFADFTRLATIAGESHNVDRLAAFVHTFDIVGIGHFTGKLRDTAPAFFAGSGRLTAIAPAFQGAISGVIGLAWLSNMVRVIRRATSIQRFPFVALPSSDDGLRAVLVAWPLALWTLFAVSGQPSHPHYTLVSYPVLFLLFGVFWADAWRFAHTALSPRWRRAVVAVVVVFNLGLLSSFGAADVALRRFVRRAEGIPRAAGYGAPYTYRRQAAQYMLDHGIRPYGMHYEMRHLRNMLGRKKNRVALGPSRGTVYRRADRPAAKCAEKVEFGPLQLCLSPKTVRGGQR